MILAGKNKTTAIFGLPASYQPHVAFEIAAAVAMGRPAFDLVTLPLHGRVVWLADTLARASDIYDSMVYWRQQKGVAIGTPFPVSPLHLGVNDDPAVIVERAPDEPALIVRDFCPGGFLYDQSMPREIHHWLDVTAPALVKKFGAAIITTISVPQHVGQQDLASHADILLGVEIRHSVGLRLHQLKPASREWLELQVHAGRDGTHQGGAGCIIAGFRANELVCNNHGEIEVLSRRSTAA